LKQRRVPSLAVKSTPLDSQPAIGFGKDSHQGLGHWVHARAALGFQAGIHLSQGPKAKSTR